MFFSTTPRPESLRTIADVKLFPYWLDNPAKPEITTPLTTQLKTDLAIIGGGYTGLWAALLAKQADPGRSVALLEGGEVAIGASGRNGGFCAASITHGFSNGKFRWQNEIRTLLRLGDENLNGIEAAVKQFDIDCEFVRSGEIFIANEEYQIEQLHEQVDEAVPYGLGLKYLDRDEIQSRVKSHSYLAGVHDPNVAMLNPAKLAWGLKKACIQLGVQIYENTPVTRLEELGNVMLLKTPNGQVEARKVALATNAFPPLLKYLSHYIVPVYDYALMTEPLTNSQRDSIGWQGREGLADGGNQFHYYRITEEGRILYGGFDAIYYRNNGVGPHLENRPASFGLLADHFFQTFPQLEGLRFTHAWGGVIDTCSRYSVFWGQAYRNKLAYAMGYTGLGVGTSRFGAQVLLDLLNGEKTERTELQMVKTKPFPFPPEPFRSPIINFTRWSLDQADRDEGRRNVWLRTLDAMGLGFDS